MSAKVVIFDNGYRCYTESNYVADEKGMLIADLYSTVNNLPLKLNELSDVQIWALCKPIISAYELGIRNTENKMTKKILKIFGLKGELE